MQNPGETHSTLSIMIVDDEMIVREDIKTILDWERFGYQITAEAANGKKACRLFAQNPVDIIIADIDMPFMNGLEMASRILEIDPGVKFIFLTSYSDFDYLRTSMRMGIHSYILKHEMEETLLLQELETLRREIRQEELQRKSPAEREAEDRVFEDAGHPGGRFELIRGYIDRNFSRDISLEELAAHFQLTESYLSHQFKERAGISFKAYLKQVRMEKAKELLLSGKFKISEISEKVGYSSLQYFYLVFKQYYGVTPAELMKDEAQFEE